MTSKSYYMAAVCIWVCRAWLIGIFCHSHRCWLRKRKPQLLWSFVRVNILPNTVFSRTTTCCMHVGATAYVRHFPEKSQTNYILSFWNGRRYVVRQTRRIIQSSNQKTHMIYGNIDVVEIKKGRKRKISSKILEIFPFQKTSQLLDAGKKKLHISSWACRYFESGNERHDHERHDKWGYGNL